MAFAVSAGVCTPGGRIVVVVTGFGLLPAVVGACIWACAAPMATTNKVAESAVLMTNPGIAAIADYAHLLGRQQPDAGSDTSSRGAAPAASRGMGHGRDRRPHGFETREDALLTMRGGTGCWATRN